MLAEMLLSSCLAVKETRGALGGHIKTLASVSFSMMHCWGRSALANITKAYVAFMCTLDVRNATHPTQSSGAGAYERRGTGLYEV